MSYSIQPVPSAGRAPLDRHEYRIRKDGRHLAVYWHDHRGDDHGLEFADGTKEAWPVGRVTDFLEGGGPRPLLLSARAVAYLDAHQG